jgi:adenosine 3'-phospho 5'-phosphosulfate transporter B2
LALCSLSNVLSSWFQYEALKYVSFPLQVLSKSSKILFTMLASRVVDGKKYGTRQYCVAALIAAGLLLFRLGEHLASETDAEHAHDGSAGQAASALDGVVPAELRAAAAAGVAQVDPALLQLLGFLLLGGYIVADSFTSTWQGVIFRTHRLSSIEMMIGVNLCSTAVSMVVMALFGKIVPALTFAVAHPVCMVHAALMSVFSAVVSASGRRGVATQRCAAMSSDAQTAHVR